MKAIWMPVCLTALMASSAIAQPPRPAPPGGMQGFGLLASDANADGKVTRAELDAAQTTRFRQIDTNNDGAVSAEERTAARDRELAAHRADAAKERFARLDADGNGQISPSELAAAPQGHASGPGGPPGHARDQRHRPKGQHGQIRGEPWRLQGREPGRARGLAPAGPYRGGLPGAQDERPIGKAEFSARAIDAFTRADVNKDGVVTISELQARSRPRP